MAVIRCVMFDFGNVLVRYRVRKFFSELARCSRNGMEPTSVFHGPNAVLPDYELGRLTGSEFYEKIRNIMELKGMSEDRFAFLFGDVLQPDAFMVDLKNRLAAREDMQLILVTNNNPYHMDIVQQKWPAVLADFASKIISCDPDVRIRKPDQEMFIRPMEQLGLKSEQCILVDDILSNVEAFRDLGGWGYHFHVSDDSGIVSSVMFNKAKKEFLSFCSNLGLV